MAAVPVLKIEVTIELFKIQHNRALSEEPMKSKG